MTLILSRHKLLSLDDMAGRRRLAGTSHEQQLQCGGRKALHQRPSGAGRLLT